MRRVVLSKQARLDIFDLASYAHEYSEKGVERIADETDKTRDLLSLFPDIGRERPDIGEGVRSVVNRKLNALFLYTRDEDNILILRVVSAKTDNLDNL